MIDLHDVNTPFSLFNSSSDTLNRHSDHYFPRFNYSACELWLCTEICHIINAGEKGLQSLSGGEVFLYNEDGKRDLTLYSSGETDAPVIEKHIEVKLIYPTDNYTFISSVNDLCRKLSQSLDKTYRLEGWVYLVWTQHYAISPDAFFETRLNRLTEVVNAREYIGASGIKYRPIFSMVKDIAEGCLTWRGQEKKIIVKAVAFSFHKEWKEILKEVKRDYAKTFEILAKR